MILVLASCSSEAEKQQIYDLGYKTAARDSKMLITNAYNEGLTDGRTLYRCDVCLNQPSYDRVIDFLEINLVDEMTEGNCVDHTAALLENAHTKGILAYAVIVNFSECGSHALIAFNTLDRGIIFFEPSTDEEVEIVMGKDYSEYICENTKCRLHIKQIGIFK